MPALILASTSPYRQQLLAKLQLPFQAMAPNCDETPKTNERASELVLRLAREKARSLQESHPRACIIGSDQVASFDGQGIIGKPGNHQQAHRQLTAASGRELTFHTGTAVIHGNTESCWLSTYQVKFRQLTSEQIERYLQLEQPYQCAGSFKSEGLGVMLFDWMRGDDPNSLIGLPLIRLYQVLEQLGYTAGMPTSAN